ncbi:YtxH domain-containing protein [Staphylococcus epidermidis]|nr:YtxH domain-containing protein [Staphylococcus epidermidis]MCD9077216.1 YtxH domain-containing protein [Staphylococcus epidermidis]
MLLIRKYSRDKLKNEYNKYNKYKENFESYKTNAKDIASQISRKVSETIQEVRNNPKDYVKRIKDETKALFEEEKIKFTGLNDNIENKLEEGKFDDEGRPTAYNNLRIVTEEELKNNKNAIYD